MFYEQRFSSAISEVAVTILFGFITSSPPCYLSRLGAGLVREVMGLRLNPSGTTNQALKIFGEIAVAVSGNSIQLDDRVFGRGS